MQKKLGKKLTAAAMAAALICALCACGSSQGGGTPTGGTAAAETGTASAAESAGSSAVGANDAASAADTAVDGANGTTGSGGASDAAGSANGAVSPTASGQGTGTAAAVTALGKPDMSSWLYNADDDVYYQLGISYCENPADASYETLAVFVPGAYLRATDNGDGTFTCTVDETAKIGQYTAADAPIVMPIDTPGYSAQAALTEYTSLSDYMEAGLIYAHAGCRGRDAGAPAGVTDLKAAIRYLRFSGDVLPGDTEKIFVFGMSGGGAQSALVGATGDSALYEPYLDAIGAVQGVSDAVCGSMDWCPITNLDSADEAYEWMMGVTRSGLSEEEQAISDAMAAAFADYINTAGFTDANGNVLTLEASDEGIWQAGSYYDYLKQVIEESLNHFLSDTEFPYDSSASTGNDGGSGGGHGGFGGPNGAGGFGGPNGAGGVFGGAGGFGGNAPAAGDGNAPAAGDGNAPAAGDGNAPTAGNGNAAAQPEFAAAGNASTDGNAADDADASYEARDNISRTEAAGGVTISGVYETAQDYIDALNAEKNWVSYDAADNTATITSVADFVTACKVVSKNLGAFDQLDAGQGENTLFGYGDGNGAHFDAVLAAILEGLGNEYAADFAADLQKEDALGNVVADRLHMYTPLYYLLESEEGYRTSVPAKYWRIRTGISQSDTSLTTELNLALALRRYAGVESVDFETVWGQKHVKAERTGSSTANFIAWVADCTAQ